MPTPILMPALSPTMEEGKLAKWLVAEGKRVKAGDIIAEIETDKATMEVEAVDEGVIGQILIAAGTEGVKVNTPIAMILGDGEATGCRASCTRRRAELSRALCNVPTHAAAGTDCERCSNSWRRPSPRVRNRGCRRAPASSSRRPCAKRCAMPWPRRCAATATCC